MARLLRCLGSLLWGCLSLQLLSCVPPVPPEVSFGPPPEEQPKRPQQREPEGGAPPEVPKIPTGCNLEHDFVPVYPIDSSVITPRPGSATFDVIPPLPLIVAGADKDQLLQRCVCNPEECEGIAVFDVSDPIAYGWSLTGPGSLRRTAGPATMWDPPPGIAVPFDVVIESVISDSHDNDPDAKYRFLVRHEPVAPCGWKRRIDILDLSDRSFGELQLGDGECGCRPHTAVWAVEPIKLDAALSGPTYVCAGKRYIIDASGKDEDRLTLSCVGECGSDVGDVSVPEEVYYDWTARRGTFPDHASGPRTNAWVTTAIYLAPTVPGPDRIEISAEDSGIHTRARDPRAGKKLDLLVVTTDLDVDSDNTAGYRPDGTQQDPERSQPEDDLEDDCRPGKTVRVNNADQDDDCVPDFADGFEALGEQGPNASASFTPLILHIPEPIDLTTATVQFVYSSSDPSAVSPAAAAPGHLRIWSKDGPSARSMLPLDRGGDYTAPVVLYRPNVDFHAPMAPRTWRFFIEGIDVSKLPGDQRVVVQVDPDGPGPAMPCEDAVRLTLIREAPKDTLAPPDPSPYLASDARPWIELDPLSPQHVQLLDDRRAQVTLRGRVFDHYADLVSGGRADVTKITYDDHEIVVTRDPAEPVTRARPYAFKGELDGTIEVTLSEGDNEFVLRTGENVINLAGEIGFTIRTRIADPNLGTLSVVDVKIGDSAPVGCFHSHFDRVHDARGNRGPLRFGSDSFVTIPDPSEPRVQVTKEPYAIIRRAPRVIDPHLRVVGPGERFEWEYDSVQGTWPVADVDLDTDVDGDGDIDDEDDPEEAFAGAIAVGINGDDDDGDGSADSSDDRFNGPDDVSEMIDVVLRRPSGIASDAGTEIKLKKSGAGKIRVFSADGSEVLLAPSASESRDLWPELQAGDLTVKVEGTARGRTVLELALTSCGPECGDQVVIDVVGWVLELGADEPFLDHDVPSDEVLVPSDHTAVDYRGTETLGLNLFALFYREDLRDSEEKPKDCGGAAGRCTVRWEVRPASGNQARRPKLRDLRDPCLTGQCWDRAVDAIVENFVSRAQLDYSFDHPVQNIPWVKAGDRFTVEVSATGPDGQQVRKSLVVELAPGSKIFHVTNPPSSFSPGTMWRLSDAQFEQRYASARFEPPPGSGARAEVRVHLFDRFRNPLPEGATAAWRLEGSGALGSLSPEEDEPLATDAIESPVGPGGESKIAFTMPFYASCPWNDVNLDPSHVLIASGSVFTSANTSVVTSDVDPPARLGPVELLPSSGGATGATRFDIAANPRITFSVQVVRKVGNQRVPLAGIPVSYASLNGKLAPLSTGAPAAGGAFDGIVVTNSAGYAPIDLTAEGAEPGEIMVLASVGTLSARADPRDLEWYSTRETIATVDRKVISPDARPGEIVAVETLDDRGESLVIRGAREGDGWLGVATEPFATVTVKGLPNHTYLVNAEDELSWGIASHYPFDLVTSTGETPDLRGPRPARVSGARIDTAQRARGIASLRFDGNDTVEIPASAAVDLAGGLLVKLHVRPRERRAATLLERAGQWRLEMLADGRLRFSVDGSGVFVESTGPLPDRVWSHVDARYDGRSIRLGVGQPGQVVDSNYALLPAAPPPTVNTGVTAGAGFRGHIDELELIKGGQSPVIVDLDGLDPSGQITTDAAGNATFTVSARPGAWNPQRWEPARVRVALSGSERAETELWVCPKRIQANLLAMGKAFLTGTGDLGTDARWYERAAAWVGEYMPIVSDLKTLFQEVYKGMTGCDSVSVMNVVFASVGLLTDICTFGTGSAIRGATLIVTGVAKAFMKEFAKNVLIGEVAKFAITQFMKWVTEQIAAATEAGRPIPRWIQDSEAFLRDMEQLGAQFSKVADAALRSVNDLFIWSRLHGDVGRTGLERVMTRLEADGAQLEPTP